MVEQAMQQMDEGYLAQDYYRRANAIIALEVEREETFDYDNYSWTEHISRKWGQWHRSTQELLDAIRKMRLSILEPTGNKNDVIRANERC